MKMTVTDLQDSLTQLLEQGIIKPDYIVAFTHQDQAATLKCYPLDGRKIAAIDAYQGSPTMLVFTSDRNVQGDEA